MPIRPSSGNISSGFGMRNGRMHNGEDIGWADGTRLVAPISGKVTYCGRWGDYGNLLEITSGAIQIRLAHMDSFDVKLNDFITENTYVGEMGNTGASGGVHVHWEVRINGKLQNPATWILQNVKPTSNIVDIIKNILIINKEKKMRLIFNKDAPKSHDATRRAVVGDFIFKVVNAPQSKRERKLWGAPVNFTQGEWDAQIESVQGNRKLAGLPPLNIVK